MGSESKKFLLPPPVFAQSENKQMRLSSPHFLTPQGMLLPKQLQPPPMYGPRGATIPPKYFKDYGKQAMLEYDTQKVEEYFCDVCDWSFKRLQDYEKHNKEHRECGIDGCTFFAHSTVINAHIEQQHNTGLYDSIKKLSTPEEIAAWREERKKRYPTKANVELRQKIQQEKLKRGEKLSMPKNRFGQKSDRERAVNRTDKSFDNRDSRKKKNFEKPDSRNSGKRKHFDKGKSKKEEENNVSKSINLEEKSTEISSQDCDAEEPPIKLFAGTRSLEDYVHKKPKVVENALSNLIGMYGSDDDSNEESCDEENIPSGEDVEENIPSKKGVEEKENISESATGNVETNSDAPLDYFNNDVAQEVALSRVVNEISNCSDDEAPEEVPFTRKVEVFEEEVNVKNESKPISSKNNLKTNEESSKERSNEGKSKKQRNVQIKKSGLDYSKLRKTKQNTMLEKLLQSEIIHERNVLLQCVRFVVENNFFDVGTVGHK